LIDTSNETLLNKDIVDDILKAIISIYN